MQMHKYVKLFMEGKDLYLGQGYDVLGFDDKLNRVSNDIDIPWDL